MENSLKRYAVTVQYIGKNYHGSQLQSNETTIQSELERALCTLIYGNSDNTDFQGKRKIKTIFSGRTDKGVNAKGQVVHFETNKSIVASQFIHSMNGLLPNDISVSCVKEVPLEFHAQKSAVKRYYKYAFYNRSFRTAFDGDLMLFKRELNVDRMKKSLSYLEGEHDFSAFRSSGTEVSSSDCFIYKTDCNKVGDTIVVDIVGNRFLYNIVRTIVGTLLLIEKNNLSPEFMKEVLDGKDRKKAGQTVSPFGLTLMKVEY